MDVATRTVRLDEEAEDALAELRRVTGLSVSAALKRGLLLARGAERDPLAKRPFDVYATLDLGTKRAWPEAVLALVAEHPFDKPAGGSRRRGSSTKRSKTAKGR